MRALARDDLKSSKSESLANWNYLHIKVKINRSVR